MNYVFTYKKNYSEKIQNRIIHLYRFYIKTEIKMKRKIIFTALLLMFAFQQAFSQTEQSSKADSFVFNPNIKKLRELSYVIPGELPIQINVEKIAETIRPASVVVKGDSPDKKMTLARTVYQVEYMNGAIMLDSGMDLETHKTFGKTPEPYFPERFELVKKALSQANLIVLTHYHADHVAGVIRSESLEELAPKTWVSELTADLLVNKPHKSTTVVEKVQVEKFLIAKDREYIPIAPGIVLFMAPGHTPDSKMLYIRLANGREYIHSVDSGWSMENIEKEIMKNASWVSENEQQLLTQYVWLNNLKKEEKDIIILCTHDDVQYRQFTENGLLGNGLKINE